jgi:hypothetical protein
VIEYLDETQSDNINDVQGLQNTLETYFRTKTYLGCVLRLLGSQKELKPIGVTLSVHLDFPAIADHKKIKIVGCDFLSSPEHHGKAYTQEFAGQYLDALSLHASLDKNHKADKLFQHFEEVITSPPDPTLRKVLIQKFDKESVKRLLFRIKRDPESNANILEPNADAAKKHKRALEYVNGMYLVISQRAYMGKYFHMGPRQIISVNGLPTNISLGTPRSALGYLANVHLVLDVHCTLGFGKRNIPGRTKGIIDAFYADAWAMLRRICPAIVGVREGKDPTDLTVWDKEKEYEAYGSTDNIFRDLPLLFKTTPKEEQEVIALFFELIGRKILKGYFPFRVGGNRATYDALFYFADESISRPPKKFSPRELRTVEFKYRLSEILVDFGNQEKFLDDIDLLICWENDCTEDTSEYNIHSLEREGIQPLPGAQFRIQKGTKFCQVLVLKDFVGSLEFGAA